MRRKKILPCSSVIAAIAAAVILAVGVVVVTAVPPPPPTHKDTSSEWCNRAVRPGVLNVHLLPHSHDDIGWLKTVDQYYYGDRNEIQLAGVQYTLDSVVSELLRSPSRRFIEVEVGFFWRWWEEQDEDTRQEVKKLVNEGRLEFINGGWVMNDEATAHYNAIIDQMSLGLRWLNATFGVDLVGSVGWQIDPFGHSREMASLFAQFGFDGVFFGRLDYQDKKNRMQKKSMEFLWDASPNDLGPSSQLLGSALFNGYNPPSGFCFDIFCNDSPINDNPRLEDYNVDEKVRDFMNVAREWADPYTTNNILMTMGSDFQYLAAHTWYKNLDKLIKYVNLRHGDEINLLYSTPTCYLQSVNAGAAKNASSWPVKSDDFFPYASDPHAFWTGYFTSRPTLKYFTHSANNFLQAAKQVATAASFYSGLAGDNKKKDLVEKLWPLKESLAVMQHHDAVAGTAKQHVTNDYAKRIDNGFNEAVDAIASAVRVLEKNTAGIKEINTCHRTLNVSACFPSQTLDDFIVRVYNPLARPLTPTYVRVPVFVGSHQSSFSVTDLASGQEITTQLVPIPEQILGVPGRPVYYRNATHELVWRVERLNPIAFSNFRVIKSDESNNELRRHQKKNKNKSDFWVVNKKGTGAKFSGQTGSLLALRSISGEITCTQSFQYYEGMSGNNTRFEFRASGAYIFRPNGSEPIDLGPPSSYKVVEGPHVTEIHQDYNSWVSQVISIYQNADTVLFRWTVGPVPVRSDGVGKEVITRWSTDLATRGTWYTDANGRELLERKRDFRPTWKYKVNEAVAGNYYPVNSRLILKDEEKKMQLAVLNDRAQGGTSLNDGEAEIMVHRRLLCDDAFGVGEALNESQFGEGLVATGTFHLLLTSSKGELSTLHRDIAEELFMGKILLFHPPKENNDVTEEYNSYVTDLPGVSTLAGLLPRGLRLLTLEPLEEWSPAGDFLLRLENYFQSAESSETLTVSRSALISALQAKSLKETLLGGNTERSSIKRRLSWTNSNNSDEGTDSSSAEEDTISFRPMRIRTFIVSK